MSMNTAKKCFKKVTHCIFDMDGLLLDTEVIYEGIVKEIASFYNKPYPFEVSVKMLGSTERKSAEIAVNDLELPTTVDEYLVVYNKMCRERLGNAPIMKGVERLVHHLAKHKVPIAVATSSGEDMVQIKIAKHQELFKLFNHRVCGSTDPEVKDGKPAPDIFLVTAARFKDNPNPAQCLAFEDSYNGVISAINAGMQVIMVPDKRVSEERRAKATLVLRTLEEFKPDEFGLPPFSSQC